MYLLVTNALEYLNKMQTLAAEETRRDAGVTPKRQLVVIHVSSTKPDEPRIFKKLETKEQANDAVRNHFFEWSNSGTGAMDQCRLYRNTEGYYKFYMRDHTGSEDTCVPSSCSLT